MQPTGVDWCGCQDDRLHLMRISLGRHQRIEAMSELTLVASLFGPLFVGLIFHGLCIKFGWLRSLAVPIDRKALFRGRALFGANKTYRGVISVALGSALDVAPGSPGGGPAMLFFYVVDQVDFLLGAWLVAWLWVPPTPLRVLWSILFVLVVHQVISGLGALLGMRSSAR
jgi:hypothetical protein